uniref:Zinc finger MYM-type containing 4 n=1 Tax=Latimeria chalumnae TaxID=7897 RepID=M3XL95_LATCH|nr:PREDICTED: zinc finger MYM-type protein 4 isoform X1 [Latimeria chalumnae]|eukprot:XP_014352652.1 PREDICTED: zinc finger MYM-type protein 4 isoform X1 [Latimeria chalumnae]
MADVKEEEPSSNRVLEKPAAVFDDVAMKCDELDGISPQETRSKRTLGIEGFGYAPHSDPVSGSLLVDDQDCLMDSADLAGIPVVDSEDDQSFDHRDSSHGSKTTETGAEDDLEDSERTASVLMSDSEKEEQTKSDLTRNCRSDEERDCEMEDLDRDSNVTAGTKMNTLRADENGKAESVVEPVVEKDNTDNFRLVLDSRLTDERSKRETDGELDSNQQTPEESRKPHEASPDRVEKNAQPHSEISEAHTSDTRSTDHNLEINKDPNASESLGNSFVPNIKIKDEPQDDEYDKALVPQQGLLDKIKDEPESSEEYEQQSKSQEGELKISAVFSVSGSPLAPQLTSGLQQSLPVNTISTDPAKPLPPSPSATIRVSCSGCKKVLQKGQTAYQRKGSTQLFCSTLCLTGYTVPAARPITATKKTCFQCLKDIVNMKEMITAPVSNIGASKDFCNQACLSAYDLKRKQLVTISTKCSMCQKNAVIRHEVNYQNVVHKLCSDVCFSRFRSANNLTMNCCENCGGYCYSGSGQCHVLQIEGQPKKFCSSTCVTAYKQKSAKITPCTLCKSLRSSAEMVESTNTLGKTELFCSVNCLSAYRVQMVTSSGAQVQCNSCKTSAVPQYHLAMSDGSIRNFCSYSCVVAFQNLFNKPSGVNSTVVPLSQGQVIVNIAAGSSAAAAGGGGGSGGGSGSGGGGGGGGGGGSSSSSSSSSTTTATTTSVVSPSSINTPAAAGLQRLAAQSQQVAFTRTVVKLKCQHCHRLFATKPELLDYKGKMLQFCGKTCCDEYKKIANVMAMCEYCKIEKIIKESARFSGIDKAFCSEGCKLLYKHDLAKRWGIHCKMCSYCSQTSPRLVQNHFGGKKEEFCSEECMSKFTVLFYQMAKCDSCKRQGKLNESLRWHGEMKHFCNLQCILVFCSQQSVQEPVAQNNTASVSQSPATGRKDSTPVIANVVSLASTPAVQPTANSNNVLQGTVPTITAKIIGDASTQTDALKLPPAAPPRMLKNKALLCKPISQTKATSCKPHTQTKECQTDGDTKPEIIVLPIPVPIFVPLPLHLYTQYAPLPLGIPVPLPVPMFLPTTLDSADKIIETIQDIKEKIPSNPFEADLLQMAEMIAEEEEKEKTVSHGDQGSTYSGDLESEAVSTPHSWEDELNHYASRANTMQEPDSDLRQLSQMDAQVDLEADFPAEVPEPVSREPPTPSRPRSRRRHRDGFPQQKRRVKKKQVAVVEPKGVPQASFPGTSNSSPTLKYMYGVNAWKSWVHWKNSQGDHEELKFGARSVKLKEDLLSCTSAELSYGLCQFIREVRRPNGEEYKPDSIFYLCLSIQQYLFENGRIDNIFTDPHYKFVMELTKMLKNWKPTILLGGYLFSRVEEEHLWECKQLGAYSPIVLLNTLLFFNTKYFQLRNVSEHQRLSFAHVVRCTKTVKLNTKMTCLRFFSPVHKKELEPDKLPLGKRKRSDEDENETIMEMSENTENPLRCPVRLFEFYLSKCSDSVKQRSDVFYLQPERSCVPNSPMWYSTLPIDPGTLDSMLTRILMVREVHEELVKAHLEDSDAEHTE